MFEMFETKTEPINFSYGGALYVKDENSMIKFIEYSSGIPYEYGKVTLLDSAIDKDSVIGTPLWSLIYDPDCDITAIRIGGSVVKIKKYFLMEVNHCVLFLFKDKLLIKITIINGDIAEYECLPGRIKGHQVTKALTADTSKIIKSKGSTVIAWLYSNSQNIELYHKLVKEDNLC